MSEYKLTTLLAKRYCAPEFAFLPQLRNGTGFTRSVVRTADGVAMSLYPSRGLHLHGFEIKVSRADFRNEIKNPEKAEDIARFCNFWWIVAPAGIVPIEEMPANWGLLVSDGENLKLVKQAVFTEAQPLDTPMLASIFRNVNQRLGEMVPKEEIAQWKETARGEIEAKAAANYERRSAYMAEKLEEKTNLVAKIEAAIGGRIDRYEPEKSLKAGRAAMAILDRGRNLIYQMENLTSTLDGLKPAMAELRTEINALKEV